MLITDIIAFYLVFLKMLLVLTATLIVISSIDDAFIDLLYWGRAIYRKLFIRNKYRPLDVERLYAIEENNFAIMVPAWQESNVICQMVENTLRTYDYKQFHIFVGTYQNDPDTQREVDKMSALYPNVHKVVTPRDGPTCKADCLNWIVQGILLHEKTHNMEFSGFVMHDAEDVVHRLELKLYNYLIDRKDLMQLPVFSMEQPWYNFTASHYIDEFAESHSKDLPVREMLIGQVPSAGVATCFSHRAMKALASENGIVFNTDSLTEDYDISFRLKKYGMEQIFLRYGVMTTVRYTSPFTGKVKAMRKVDYVATREFFPDSINTAVRQKSRWILGIVFQGWKFVGWRGNLGIKYILFRDRKGVFASLATFLAYFLTLNGILLVGSNSLLSHFYSFPPLLEIGSFPWWLAQMNIFFFASRLFHRMLFTGMLYGYEQALLSVPRLFVSNFINFLATMRAIRLFIFHMLTGKTLVWDKTHHSYPSLEQLSYMKQKLGEMLLERKLITKYALDEALKMQSDSKRPLGEILLGMEALDISSLSEVLGLNLGITAKEAETKLLSREVA